MSPVRKRISGRAVFSAWSAPIRRARHRPPAGRFPGRALPPEYGLPPVQAVLLFAHAGARTKNIRQAVVVIPTAPTAPRCAGGFPDRSRPARRRQNPPHRQLAAWVQPGFQRSFAQMPGVGRRGPHRRGLKLAQHRQQPLGRQRAGVDGQGPSFARPARTGRRQTARNSAHGQ